MLEFFNGKIKQKRKDDFKGHIFFSNGKTNAYDALTAYFGKETFTVKKKQIDKEDCILILDVAINDSDYILLNFYNANTEKEQIDVLGNMFALLEELDTNLKKQLIVGGDFDFLN